MTCPPKPVLVVEDLDADFEFLERAFRRRNPRPPLVRRRGVEEAEAFLRTARPRPGLVVLDLRLCDGDGTEVLDALKAEPDLAAIPVVIWSGSPDPTSPAICRARGADLFLRKNSDGRRAEEAFDSLFHVWTEVAALPGPSR